MRLRPVVLALCAGLLLAACSSDGGGDGAGDPDETTTTEGSAFGEVDCASIRSALNRLGVDVQLIAQLRSEAQLGLVADGTLELDLDETLAAIEAIRPLEAIDVEGTLGDVEESLDRYEQAARLAGAALAADDPVVGGELADLTEHVGALASFLEAQSPISAAFAASGCT